MNDYVNGYFNGFIIGQCIGLMIFAGVGLYALYIHFFKRNPWDKR